MSERRNGERRKCGSCASALALLNQHLKGRVYTSLDDALRNMLQAYVTMRDNEACNPSAFDLERQHEDDGMLIAARLLCGLCREDKPVMMNEAGFVTHGARSCVAWKIRKELLQRRTNV